MSNTVVHNYNLSYIGIIIIREDAGFCSVFDVSQYIETAKNLDKAGGEETLELLLVFSGVSVVLIIAPALYFITEEVYIAGIGVVLGIMDLIMSQYLPSRIETESE